jgi:hypothetical protein
MHRFARHRSRRPSRRRLWLPAAAAAALLVGSSGAQAAEPVAEIAPPAATAAPDPLMQPAAVALVKRMVQTLGNAETLSYHYDESYDALQEDGEILEFGRRGETAIRRPDHVHGEQWNREGRHVEYFYDGQTVSVFDETHNAYATTPRTGDLDSVTDFLRDDVGFRMPLADLFGTDLGPMLIQNGVAARVIGKEKIGDVECDHVAIRLRQGADVQLWIRTGEMAVPERIVINYATADGRPQFRANLSEWDLSSVPDRRFRFDAPKRAKAVPFMTPKRRAVAAAQEDGQ